MSAITERRDMGLYEVLLSVSGFGIGTMLANFHVGGMFFVKSSFKHTRDECESKRAYVYFRCLIFNLSGPCKL